MTAYPKPERKRMGKVKKVPRAVLFRRLKKLIHDKWSKIVRLRDTYCVLCGGSSGLNAHHWIVNAGRSLAARFCLGNGVTLCYACHIFKVHATAASVYIDQLKAYMVPRFISEEQYQEIAALVSKTADYTLEELQALNDQFTDELNRCQKQGF